MKKIFILLLLLLFPLFTNIVHAEDINNSTLESLLENFSLIAFESNVTVGNKTAASVFFHVTGGVMINSEPAIEPGTTYTKPLYDFTTTTIARNYSCGVGSYLDFGDVDWGKPHYLRRCSAVNIDFTTLYNNIVTKQALIQDGITIEGENTIELTPGINYNISNINDVKEIHFKDIAKNANGLTIITIKESGTVNLPSLYWLNENNEKNIFITNDKFGGKTNYSSETNNFSGPMTVSYVDVYYGNIVWNLPNATSITFTGVPFVGHVIAPNANATMPEMNTAGSLIVKSLHGTGLGEIHFYPLKTGTLSREYTSKSITITLDCDCEDGDTRPDSVVVYLMANGVKIGTVTLTRENNYTFDLTNLPESFGGTDIVYTLGGEYIENSVEKMEGFAITSKCANKLDPSEVHGIEGETDQDKKNEDNPNTDDKVPYVKIISIISLVVLLTITVIVYIKKSKTRKTTEASEA